MTTLIAFHEVDDVPHWLASTIRAEAFASVGATVTTFVDPGQSNRVGLLIEAPDVEKLREMLGSAAAAEAMEKDGVRPETIVMLVQA
jgi:hypothetical protein